MSSGTNLVLFEVAQSLDDDAAAALVLWVPGTQSHDAPRLADQMLNLPLVFHNLFLLPLETGLKKQVSLQIDNKDKL